MKALLNSWNPLSLLFLSMAGIFMFMGFVSGFQHIELNLFLVIACAVNALLIQNGKKKNND